MQVMLPYRTDWRSVMTLLDYVKGKGVDRATLESRIGSGESFRETLNTAEQLALVERDEGGDIRLTQPGQGIAYAANDADRRRELAITLCRYIPYRVPLERAAKQSASVIDGPSVERTWQVDLRLGQPRNRVEEARTLFFRLADEAGLGTFRRGVRGQPTRLELSSGFHDLVRELLDETSDDSVDPPDPEPVPDVDLEGNARRDHSVPANLVSRAGAATGGVELRIQVDMTEWDLDKIEAFLKMVGLHTRDEA